jgi:hypothetical protein
MQNNGYDVPRKIPEYVADVMYFGRALPDI